MGTFFGIAHSNENIISKLYYDDIGKKVQIKADSNGWCIVYIDYDECESKCVERSVDDNFKEAYYRVLEKYGPLSTKYNSDHHNRRKNYIVENAK